jgi:hypothetical protein
MMLLHELAHVRRRDCLVELGLRLLGVLQWFNPAVGLIAARLRLERERACDDEVLRHGHRPSAYAEQLLMVARLGGWRNGSRPAPALAMAVPFTLERRLVSILSRDPRRWLGGPAPAARAGWLLALALVALAPPMTVNPAAGKGGRCGCRHRPAAAVPATPHPPLSPKH